MPYDFCIRNGDVIDPSNGCKDKKDIFIRRGKIVAGDGDKQTEIIEEIDASGMLVIPGMIDFHTHLAWRGSDIGLQPDLYMLPNGVTSAVDAGSCGTCNYESMVHDVINRSMITVRSFLNVTATGIITDAYLENLTPAYYDKERIEMLIERYPEEILGLKVRIGRRFSKELGLSPLIAAKELATCFGLPVCVHVVEPQVDYGDVLSILSGGDIICHCFQHQGQYSILNEKEEVLPAVYAARKRGVIFDCAPSCRNRSMRVLCRAIEQGFYPDIISTDVVTHSVYRKPLFGLPYTISEYYAAGMPLQEIVRAVTETPARLMGQKGKIGTLDVGAAADVTVLKMVEHPTVFKDWKGETLSAKYLFVPQLTIKSGIIAYRNIEYL